MADADEEFDIFDEQERAIGRASRKAAHQQGLLHKAVYVFLFSHESLLLQRRSLKKLIGPGQWDVSVAEHLQPGESYREAAVRGLKEELGIVLLAGDAVVGPLAPSFRRSMVVEGVFSDQEFVQVFRLDTARTSVVPDPQEVEATQFRPWNEVLHAVEESPEEFTPWLREQVRMLGPLLQPG